MLRVVDMHHHLVPPRYAKDARDALIAQTEFYDKMLGWTPAHSLEEMDRFGTDVAVTTMTVTSIWFGDDQNARALARDCNEYAARLSADHPGRFVNLAVLPLPDVEGALRELEYACDTLKTPGVGILTSYGDHWPSHPDFKEFFQELNRRKIAVHFHPTTPPGCQSLIPGVADNLLEFFFDTARAIVSLLFDGSFARYPDTRFIFSHAGGVLPQFLDRLERRVAGNKSLQSLIPDGVRGTLAKLYYDTATSSVETNLGNLLKFVPIGQILFGSDMPFAQSPASMKEFDTLFPDPEIRAAVRGGNALRLLAELPHHQGSAASSAKRYQTETR